MRREMAHIVGRWSEAAVRLAFHLTRDREAALDLSQEAFVKAMDALATLQDVSMGQVWFTRIVVNLCRDWLRRKKVEANALANWAHCAGKGRASTDATGRLEHKEALERARQAMMSLPLPFREALALVAVEGNSSRDASEILGIPEGTLRSRVHEARKLLQKELERESDRQERQSR